MLAAQTSTSPSRCRATGHPLPTVRAAWIEHTKSSWASVVSAEQYFDFAFRFVESLLALARKSYALLEQLERTIEREIASLKLADDLLELFER